jgi:hypothetical protein
MLDQYVCHIVSFYLRLELILNFIDLILLKIRVFQM